MDKTHHTRPNNYTHTKSPISSHSPTTCSPTATSSSRSRSPFINSSSSSYTSSSDDERPPRFQRLPPPIYSNKVANAVINAKKKHRTDIPWQDWDREGFATSNVCELALEIQNDNAYILKREHCHQLSLTRFINEYERPYLPVMIDGIPEMEQWPARTRWTLKNLRKLYKHAALKCGEDDDGHTIRMKLKYFLSYLKRQTDDSPLYIFDSSFEDREDTKAFVHDYTVPKYFQSDLFHYVGEERRPPYRWFLVGPKRSGTCVHIDPLGTSAWNTLLSGRKRWVLFPPHLTKAIVQGKTMIKKGEDDEAVNYFMDILPRMKAHYTKQELPLMEFIQYPGETVFIPGGWWHAVLNIEDTVAVTQNFCSRQNFDTVWRKTRKGRKKMAVKWLRQLQKYEPDLATRAIELNKMDSFTMYSKERKDHHLMDEHHTRLFILIKQQHNIMATESNSLLNDLQQHLQLEAVDGKYLTRQEIALLELFGSTIKISNDGNIIHTVNEINATTGNEGDIRSNKSSGNLSGLANISTGNSTGKKQLSIQRSISSTSSTSALTPKRHVATDRERVQNFLAQRSNSSILSSSHATDSSRDGDHTTGSVSGSSSTANAISARERVKQLMAKKGSIGGSSNVKISSDRSSTGVKRSNPLTDILKGNVVGGVQAMKRLRATKSDKPGEIKINGGRSSIQLPLESFLRTEDWDSNTATAPLELTLPEVAFSTNNTLIIHATMPERSPRCCFNISTQTRPSEDNSTVESSSSSSIYRGTVLYHINPRKQRGGIIIQNSNINGRWGCSQQLPRCPITFGEPFTLRLTISDTGFLVFMEEIFQDEFKHRVPIREGENLTLSVPLRDENGHPEGVIVHSVWWGHAVVPQHISGRRYNGKMDHHRSGPGGSGSGYRYNPPHPFEVYVGNLPSGTSREELGFLFQYLGYETVRITARGYGFVTLRSAEDMNRAVEDLDGKDFNGKSLMVSCALPPKSS